MNDPQITQISQMDMNKKIGFLSALICG